MNYIRGQLWRSLGLIYDPSLNGESDLTYASVPVLDIGSLQREGNEIIVYFSVRNQTNRSYTKSVSVNLLDLCLSQNGRFHDILSPGAIGQFDDSGAMATWQTTYKNRDYLYYIGWNLGVTVPFRNSIGLAIRQDDGEYFQHKGPIVDRTMFEPHFVASCCVLPSDDIWRMWYLSCVEWVLFSDVPVHRYHIKYAESFNGIDWQRSGKIAIDFKSEAEIAISRPSVLFDAETGQWNMWYSYREIGKSYSIGYASSIDGINWVRRDELITFQKSGKSWDQEMIEYPYVFQKNGSTYMLYNGNNYGKTGFGIAVLVD